MKCLFIVKDKTLETLGPMYLSAIIKRAGHECYITDLAGSVADFVTLRPDVVLYSVMTGDQDMFKTLNRTFKRERDFISIVGGCHPTFFPEFFYSNGFDRVITGEAEHWIADFFNAEVDITPDLDSLPFPDREDFPDRPIRDFISSRGCPYKCHYCFNARWSEMYPDLPKVRMRSVHNVLLEIKTVAPKFTYFQDSCFGVNLEWLRNFCAGYAKEINAPFHCHLRPTQVSQERVDFLRLANCVSVRIALETASDRLRKVIGRANTSNQETIDAAERLHKGNIKLMIQNMLALPTSTIEDDLATLEVNIRCRPDYAWSSIFSPFPGTALGDECKASGYYTGDYSDITDCFFDKSILNFSEEYKEQTYCLQKIFALAVEAQVMPELDELSTETLPKFIHRAMRRIGDNRMYGGVI